MTGFNEYFAYKSFINWHWIKLCKNASFFVVNWSIVNSFSLLNLYNRSWLFHFIDVSRVKFKFSLKEKKDFFVQWTRKSSWIFILKIFLLNYFQIAFSLCLCYKRSIDLALMKVGIQKYLHCFCWERHLYIFAIFGFF